LKFLRVYLACKVPTRLTGTINDKQQVFIIPAPPPATRLPQKGHHSPIWGIPPDLTITSPGVDSFRFGWLKTFPIAVVDLDLPPVNLSNRTRGFPRQQRSSETPFSLPKCRLFARGLQSIRLLFTVLPSEIFDNPVAAHQGLVELLRQVVHVDPPWKHSRAFPHCHSCLYWE
jgi:hypothetical protein